MISCNERSKTAQLRRIKKLSVQEKMELVERLTKAMQEMQRFSQRLKDRSLKDAREIVISL